MNEDVVAPRVTHNKRSRVIPTNPKQKSQVVCDITILTRKMQSHNKGSRVIPTIKRQQKAQIIMTSFIKLTRKNHQQPTQEGEPAHQNACKKQRNTYCFVW